MRVLTIIPIQTKRGIIPADSIIDIPEDLIPKLAGKIAPAPPEALQNAPQATNTAPPTSCQALKLNGRVCGGQLREGLNGFLSCADPACQVPAVPHGMIRRGGKI